MRKSTSEKADCVAMFTIQGIHNDGSQSESCVDAETLEEALLHLEHLIMSELEDPGGPMFDTYAIRISGTTPGVMARSAAQAILKSI